MGVGVGVYVNGAGVGGGSVGGGVVGGGDDFGVLVGGHGVGGGSVGGGVVGGGGDFGVLVGGHGVGVGVGVGTQAQLLFAKQEQMHPICLQSISPCSQYVLPLLSETHEYSAHQLSPQHSVFVSPGVHSI